MQTFKEQLIELNACNEAIEWVGEKTFKEAWEQAERGDWMLWIYRKLYPDNLRELTLAKGHYANIVRHLMKDDRSINAVDIAIKFGKKEATIEQLNAAAYAAAAAAYAAAAAAAYAAYAAAAADADADAADAYAADAAAYAAYAAAYAAYAAAAADADAADAYAAYAAYAAAAALKGARKQTAPAQKISGEWYAKLEKCKFKEDVDALGTENATVINANPALRKLFVDTKAGLPAKEKLDLSTKHELQN